MGEHRARAHSRFPASSAHRWFRCPGSVALCADLPETRSAYAEEGERAHEYLESVLMGRPLPMVQSDMAEAVEVLVDYARDILDVFPDAVLLCEQRVAVPSRAAPDVLFGTCDIAIYIPSLRLLYVIDYKHGSGVFVDVRGNEQLQYYAVGLLNDHPEWDVERIALVVAQPRISWANPVREWWRELPDVIAFRSELEERVTAALVEDAPLVPGDDQCRFCPAAVTCPAREKLALKVVGETFADVRQVTAERLPNVADMPLDKIGHVLVMADLVEDWFSEVRKRAFELAQSGVHVPGRKLVEAQAKRSFDDADSDEKIVALSEQLSTLTSGRVPAEAFRQMKIGVTHAEGLLKRDARAAAVGDKKRAVEEIIMKFAFFTTKRSSGNLSLVADQDPRPAVDRASSAFAETNIVPLKIASQ